METALDRLKRLNKLQQELELRRREINTQNWYISGGEIAITAHPPTPQYSLINLLEYLESANPLNKLVPDLTKFLEPQWGIYTSREKLNNLKPKFFQFLVDRYFDGTTNIVTVRFNGDNYIVESKISVEKRVETEKLLEMLEIEINTMAEKYRREIDNYWDNLYLKSKIYTSDPTLDHPNNPIIFVDFKKEETIESYVLDGYIKCKSEFIKPFEPWQRTLRLLVTNISLRAPHLGIITNGEIEDVR